ncbi:MAG TPA: hypothetical protein VMB48_13160 [Steroidobacteraceae bacterium]|nr:hypothetical protein [Steroidobacteraceae bacterium]
MDQSTGTLAAGTVDVQVIQVSDTAVSASNVITGLRISAPPPVPADVTGVGVVTAMFLTASQNVSGSIQADAATNSALSTLSTDLVQYSQDLGTVIAAINTITGNPGQSVSLTTANGSTFTLNATVLALSDQLALAYVTQFDQQAGLSAATSAFARALRREVPPRERASSSTCFNSGDPTIDAEFCSFEQYGQTQATVGAQAVQTGAQIETGLYLGVLGGWAIDGLAEGGTLLQESSEAAQLIWSAASSHIAAYATASKPPPVSDSLKDVLGEVVDQVALGGLGLLPAALQADTIYEDASAVLGSSAGESPEGGLLLPDANPAAPSATTPVDSYQSTGSTQLAVATTSQASTVANTSIQPYITVITSGSGSVTSSPAGISCGSTCATSVAAGTALTLTATPGTGATFTGWSGGGCSGTGTCAITASANAVITATFAGTSGSATPTITLVGTTCSTNTSTETDTATFTLALTGPVDSFVEIPLPYTASCGTWSSVAAGNEYTGSPICLRSSAATSSATTVTASTSDLNSLGTPFPVMQEFAIDTYSDASGVVQAAVVNATAQCD